MGNIFNTSQIADEDTTEETSGEYEFDIDSETGEIKADDKILEEVEREELSCVSELEGKFIHFHIYNYTLCYFYF